MKFGWVWYEKLNGTCNVLGQIIFQKLNSISWYDKKGLFIGKLFSILPWNLQAMVATQKHQLQKLQNYVHVSSFQNCLTMQVKFFFSILQKETDESLSFWQKVLLTFMFESVMWNAFCLKWSQSDSCNLAFKIPRLSRVRDLKISHINKLTCWWK